MYTQEKGINAFAHKGDLLLAAVRILATRSYSDKECAFFMEQVSSPLNLVNLFSDAGDFSPEVVELFNNS